MKLFSNNKCVILYVYFLQIAWDKNTWGISWLNFYWIQIWTPQITQINA